jgi:hypothetical protein
MHGSFITTKIENGNFPTVYSPPADWAEAQSNTATPLGPSAAPRRVRVQAVAAVFLLVHATLAHRLARYFSKPTFSAVAFWSIPIFYIRKLHQKRANG